MILSQHHVTPYITPHTCCDAVAEKQSPPSTARPIDLLPYPETHVPEVPGRSGGQDFPWCGKKDLVLLLCTPKLVPLPLRKNNYGAQQHVHKKYANCHFHHEIP
uniref:Uncharacterized protein n=1 Tax=Eutreptiella gymnastica TaxID=73025 RepID=A0A7S4LLE7_9EUGL